MKKNIKFYIGVLLLGLIQTSIFSQENISNRMYSDFRDLDEVTYFSFSKNLIDFVDLDIDSDTDDAEKKITGDLNEIKVVIYKPDFKPEKSFREQVLKYLNKGDYDLVEEDDNEDDTEVWIHRKGKKIYECHVIFQGEQNGVLLSFFGDFNVKDVSKLMKKIDDYK